eukprot:TRINITY_DN12357_c0_g1_i1.p1 TRINITY_DN12357_c0_g1~~TRINITY_DN12357_c0_g1_i1.p1  ORF type:complete len:459 (-),score=99.45 TRINITY_DN12357_c0_g1_i1:118-1437(-)
MATKASISGWLVKEGHFVKNFKRRWVVITDTLLQYFVSEPKVPEAAGTFLKGTFQLQGCTVQQTGRSGRKHCFELTNGEHHLLLSAESESSMLDWIDAIEDSNRPLHRACRVGDITWVQSLLGTASAPPVSSVDGNDRTPLYYAARSGITEICRLLLLRSAPINAISDDGRTALWIAANHGHEEIVTLLLKHGAFAEVPIQAELCGTAVLVAAKNGHLPVVEMLLTINAAVNPPPHSEHGTPLTTAAGAGHTDICLLLIKNGADVNARCRNGSTALHLAAAGGHAAVVQLLVDNMANTVAQDGARQTALQIASARSHNGVVTVLLAAGAALAQVLHATNSARDMLETLDLQQRTAAQSSPKHSATSSPKVVMRSPVAPAAADEVTAHQTLRLDLDEPLVVGRSGELESPEYNPFAQPQQVMGDSRHVAFPGASPLSPRK